MQKFLFSLFAFALSLPLAAGTITLTPSTPSVNVGQSFTVDVVYSGLPSGIELVGFGFNVVLSGNLELTSFSVNSLWVDASDPNDPTDPNDDLVAGFAFPGLTGDPISLAVLNLTALNTGAGSISVSGIYDASFLGLYFVDSIDPLSDVPGESINGSTTVRIDGSSEIPEPSTALLLLLGAPALLLRRRA